MIEEINQSSIYICIANISYIYNLIEKTILRSNWYQKNQFLACASHHFYHFHFLAHHLQNPNHQINNRQDLSLFYLNEYFLLHLQDIPYSRKHHNQRTNMRDLYFLILLSVSSSFSITPQSRRLFFTYCGN